MRIFGGEGEKQTINSNLYLRCTSSGARRRNADLAVPSLELGGSTPSTASAESSDKVRMVNGYECGVSIGSGGNGAWGWTGESPTNCDTPSLAAGGPGSACGDSFAGKEHLGASLGVISWEEMRRSPGSISAQSTDRRFVPQDSDSRGGVGPGQSGAGPVAGHVATMPLNPTGIVALYAAQAALVASTMPNACSLNFLAAIAPLLPNRGISPQEGSFAVQECSASSPNSSVSPSNQLLSASQRPGRGANMRLGAGKRASSTEKESPLSKRKAKNDLELDATEILVAEILSSGWSRTTSELPQLNTRGKSSGSAGGKRGTYSRVSSMASSPRSISSESSVEDMPAKGRVSHSSSSAARVDSCSALSASPSSSPGWALAVVEFLHENGQDLLHAICSHYRIDYNGELSSIRDYSMEQVAHNALFNPALPKIAGRLPMMLRDIPGVSDFKMTFLRDSNKIYRSMRVTANLKGTITAVTCRACSYCGSCFSGRFMKPNAMHQQAGGWKEITDKTAAGKFSWDTLLGHRLCVPCFTHFASNGTNVNANRPSIQDLIQSEGYDLNEEYTALTSAPRATTSRKAESRRRSRLSESPRAWQRTARAKAKAVDFETFAENMSQANCMLA